MITYDKEFDATNEILISRPVLEENIGRIGALEARVRELQTEHGYQMRQMDLSYETKVKQIHAGYIGAIEELKRKNETMENEHVQVTQNMNVTITTMKREQEENVEKLENHYNEKLIVEYEKGQHLEEVIKKLRNDYERQLADLGQSKAETEERITNDFLNQLKEKDVSIDEVRLEMISISHFKLKHIKHFNYVQMRS